MILNDNFCKSIIENMITAFAYHKIKLDPQGTPVDYEYIEVNKAFEEFTSLSRTQVVGKTIKEIVPDIIKDEFDWIAFYGKVALTGEPAHVQQYSAAFEKWYLVNAYSTEKGYFAAIFIDITEIKRKEAELVEKNDGLGMLYEEVMASEEELRQQLEEIQAARALLELSEERYKTLVNNSKDMIFSVDKKGILTTVNERFCQEIELGPEAVIGQKIGSVLKNLNKHSKLDNSIAKVIKNKEVLVQEFDYKTSTGTTNYFEVTLAPILDSKSQVIGVTGANHDITVRKLNEQKILLMAYHDPLINLPNRTLFLNMLRNAIAMSRRTDTKVVVMFMDLDNFKKINDTLGHATGDELLTSVSKRILLSMREYDSLARLSGDEFSVLLQNISKQSEIVPILDRIKTVFSEPFIIQDNVINMTASMGVAVYPDDGELAEDLIKNADTAMYKAKEQGKNGYQFFSFDMKEELIRKTVIERMLRKALKGNEFVLYYQPQYETRTTKLRGFEALIRWNNPEIGFVSPMEFIPIAEEAGMIVGIGEWVLKNACIMGRKIYEKFGVNFMMSVNISPVQLKQKDFAEMVLKIIQTTGINPNYLELELTEGIFITNFDEVIAILKILQDIGVRIALDDFGMGYSSLSYLKKLPLNLLKIDRSFINEIDPQNAKYDLTESIISLVHKLHIETLAEGVETQEQMEYLQNGMCDYTQGYFLKMPVPENAVFNIIKESGL